MYVFIPFPYIGISIIGCYEAIVTSQREVCQIKVIKKGIYVCLMLGPIEKQSQA